MEIYVVTPSIRLDGTNAVATHRARVLQAREGTLARAEAGCARTPPRRATIRQPRAEQHEKHVADRPESCLLIERQDRLDDQRVREQPDQAARVSGGVQEVRIASGVVPARHQPALEQRARRRHDEEGRPNCEHEHAEQPQRRRRVRGRRRESAADRQCGDRQYEHEGVNDRLARGTEQTRRRMRVAVTGEQNRLEEEHRGRPDGLGAAEERQDHPSNHRLHEEDERRPGEDGGREEPERGPMGQARMARRGGDLGGGQVHKGNIGRPSRGLNPRLRGSTPVAALSPGGRGYEKRERRDSNLAAVTAGSLRAANYAIYCTGIAAAVLIAMDRSRPHPPGQSGSCFARSCSDGLRLAHALAHEA